ncbi:hypothetical protein JHK82_026179 [Glycine max]|uniref:Uncharacterized protein n=2 Tax=Glycine subgen. Soja TaxID=1462606 RepID=A0A0R0IDC4_SOYBN|nr:hypothetical protein JHK85_026790 [Glycine max]KAG5014042.1 hypothetical protein JHK86_026303 [Glycine max]KAG5134991.1 hypothetical protein JHK82_026179 [Glycine max]RZB93840.1 hypothetical protein D0Y65_025256 [Glycine soja]
MVEVLHTNAGECEPRFESKTKRKRDRESISWWKEGITIADWQRRPTTFPKRFRLAKDTTFGQRHLNKWSQSSFSLWMAFARIVNHYFVNNVGQN